MNQERAVLKGRLAELKHDVEALEGIASDEIIRIRGFVDPYQDDVKSLNLVAAQVSLDRLKEVQQSLIEKCDKIKRIERELKDG